jgi:putative NADH-flavin reductase
MKVAVIGASGKVGRCVVAEAETRGHQVTKIRSGKSRPASSAEQGDYRFADIRNHEEIAAAVAGHDAVVVAVHLDMTDPAVHADDPAVHEVMANAILDGLAQANVLRTVIVGGSGSLRVPPGVFYAFAPDFPNIYFAHASAQTRGWEVIRDADTPVAWSYVSPAFRIHLDPGERTGKFRVGSDYLLTDENGLSRISYEDLAIAVVDELESPSHVREMFTVAY